MYTKLEDFKIFRIKENHLVKWSLYLAVCFSLILYFSANYSNISYAQESDYQINKTKITDSIYLLHGPNANVLVSIGNDSTILVDSEMQLTSEKIKKVISEITDKPIKYIINTHWHPDHSEGNINFGKEGAIIIAHDLTRERLTTSQFTSFDNTTSPPLPEIGLPIITYTDSMKLFQNDDEIRIIHQENGHTDGDSIVYFTKNNVLYLADLFSDKAYPYIDKESNGNIDDLITSLKNSTSLINDQTKIVGGHSGVANVTQFNYYVNMLTELRDKVKEMKESGKSLEDVLSENLTKKYYQIYHDNSYVDGNDLSLFIYETLK